MKKIKVYIEVSEKDFDAIAGFAALFGETREVSVNKEKLQSVPDELELSSLGLDSVAEIELQKKGYAVSIAEKFDIFEIKEK